MSVLDQETLRRFVKLAGDRLTGDWVIISGCVLHLLGIGQRTTFDIDVAGPKEAGMDQAVTLMELAEELGLPVEAINQAGAFLILEHARERQDPIDAQRVAKAARRVLDGGVSKGHGKRIGALLAALG